MLHRVDMARVIIDRSGSGSRTYAASGQEQPMICNVCQPFPKSTCRLGATCYASGAQEAPVQFLVHEAVDLLTIHPV